jgi:hypothetical protein
LLWVGVLGATNAASGRASAAPEDEEPIRMTYQAPAGCPSEIEFVTRIRARSTRARVALPGESARTFDVLVDAGPPPSGRVMILDTDIPFGTRRVEADTCADVADALALVIALSIDPHASSPPVPAPKPAPASDPVEPRPSAEPASDEPPRESGSTNQRGGLFAGADFAVTYGVAPSALLTASPYVGWRSSAEGIFDPTIRLALVHATDDGHPVPTGSADYAWTAGRLDLCPTDWRWSSVRLIPCARIEGGVLTVAPHDVGLPERRVRPWFAAGLLARAQWSFLRPMFLDADVDVLLRATDDRFYFVPDTTVYRVPIVGASAGIGLGAHFL